MIQLIFGLKNENSFSNIYFSYNNQEGDKEPWTKAIPKTVFVPRTLQASNFPFKDILKSQNKNGYSQLTITLVNLCQETSNFKITDVAWKFLNANIPSWSKDFLMCHANIIFNDKYKHLHSAKYTTSNVLPT